MGVIHIDDILNSDQDALISMNGHSWYRQHPMDVLDIGDILNGDQKALGDILNGDQDALSFFNEWAFSI